MSEQNGKKQVSLAGIAQKPAPKPEKKKAKTGSKKHVLHWVLLIAVLVIVGLLVAGYFVLFGHFEKGPELSTREMVEYTVTPDAMSGKVSYYAVGVVGDGPADRMDMAAVLCFDRKASKLSFVQLPVASYIGKDTGFAVPALGDVWANPQPEVFCSSCRVRLKPDEIQDGKHTLCGAPTENRPGSAYGDFIRVINTQYGLPVDNYVVFTRSGLEQFIDGLGGVDIKLPKKLKLGDISYEAGVQNLTGKAAVDYAVLHEYDGTPKSDLNRLERQREVLAAVLRRLQACKEEDLYRVDKNTGHIEGVLGKLMLGAEPIRFNSTAFGKSRLLNISETAAEDMKLSLAIAKFFKQVGEVPLANVTVGVLPGEPVKSGSNWLYSANRAKTQELVAGIMNPYGLTLDESTVTVPQLKDKQKDTDAVTVTLDTVGVEQGNAAAPEGAAE